MSSSWVGIKVRRDKKDLGIITRDLNSAYRVLNVKLDSGESTCITMSNIGKDPNPDQVARWEWWLENSPNSSLNNSWLSFGD